MTDLPGGTYVIEAAAARRYAEAIGEPPGGELNPVWAFIASMGGLGLSIEELFASAGCRMEDGPMLGECAIELERPLAVERPYAVRARVLDTTRKTGRSGAFDLMRVRAALADDRGDAATCTMTYVIPRREEQPDA